MSGVIGPKDPYIYNKPDTASASEAQKTENKPAEPAKETEKNSSETKTQEPKEKVELKNLKLGKSDPVSKLLDFGAFDYKRSAINDSVEKSKDVSTEKDQMKFIINEIKSNPAFKEALASLVEAHGNIAEALDHMAPHFVPFKRSINNEEGSIGAEFFKKLQQVINP